MINFSKNLKFLLKSTGTTQQELGDYLSMRHTAVSSWINNAAKPRSDKIDKIADYFGVTPSDLQYTDLTATPEMIINIRAHGGSHPNVQILDTAKESTIAYRIDKTSSQLREEDSEKEALRKRVSFLEGQIEVYRELLNK